MTAVYRHQSSSSAVVDDATLEPSSSKKRRVSQTSASDEKVSHLDSGSATVEKPGARNAPPGETADPKEVLGKTVGPFRFTSKQHYYKSGGQYGGWEAACPFHKKMTRPRVESGLVSQDLRAQIEKLQQQLLRFGALAPDSLSDNDCTSLSNQTSRQRQMQG